ncbi:MAG: hypothetical protein QG646_4111 [Euryarchaeota archaeon]|nr:hypothetical protein [Euryarchaeota archaeon]
MTPKSRKERTLPKQKGELHAYGERDKLFIFSLLTSHSAHFFSPISFPPPDCSYIPSGLLYLNLNIYRESTIKALIKEQSEDLYRLIKRIHFDGNFYRVNCLHSGGWEYCWDLAVRVQFFGMMQGLAFEPEKIVIKKEKRIIYRSVVLVNPCELWDKRLVERLWNLQERIEFVIAKILYHECIHILIYFGKTLPAGVRQTDVFLEFKQILKFANSNKLCPESSNVQSCLRKLTDLARNYPKSSEEKLNQVSELYEFLIHEKYSIDKTDMAFGLYWSNTRVSMNYAKLAALRIGSCTESNSEPWNKEVNRLHKCLKDLYDRIDNNCALNIN